MCCELVALIALWIRTDLPGIHMTFISYIMTLFNRPTGVGPLVQSIQIRAVADWVVILAFTTVL